MKQPCTYYLFSCGNFWIDNGKYCYPPPPSIIKTYGPPSAILKIKLKFNQYAQIGDWLINPGVYPSYDNRGFTSAYIPCKNR